MADLEPTSQMNFPVDPAGQTRYVGRPTTAGVGAALASVHAPLVGIGAITFPLTINGANDTLLLKDNSAAVAFTTVTLGHAVYASLATLLVAVNAALVAAGLNITAPSGLSTTRLILMGPSGPGAYIANDTVLNGSTANTDLGLPDGATWTIPTAAATITALLPVGGPLDVSTGTLATAVSPMLTAAQILAIQDAIAPQFVETDVAIKSFEVGNLAGYLKATYSPDPSRLPALALGAAITVVQNDGVSLFTAPVPTISGAVHNVPNPGDLTITGTGLGNSEWDAVKVKVSNPTTGAVVVLDQKIIETTVSGGTTGAVSATSIVIPASLLHGLGVAGNVAQVKYTSLASNRFTTT
jgi:hypothetical protein